MPQEAAASGSSAVLPRMAANSLFLPSTATAQTRTAERKAAAARATHFPASTQRASAVAEQGLGVTLLVPRLMLGVHQWLPEDSINCLDHSQDTPSSHYAAAESQLSNAGLDADRLKQHLYQMPLETVLMSHKLAVLSSVQQPVTS
ncbi:TPA: hypothetical protein ACH3X3_014911 [Trebouxia sp. C0006]